LATFGTEQPPVIQSCTKCLNILHRTATFNTELH
jgi:hypothetical protein